MWTGKITVGVFDRLKSAASGAWDTVKDTASASAKFVEDTLSSGVEKLEKTAKTVTETVTNLPEKAVETASSLSTTVSSLSIGKITNTLGDVASYAWKHKGQIALTALSLTNPVTALTFGAPSMVKLAKGEYQNTQTGETVRVHDSSKSITSMLKGSEWESTVNQTVKDGNGSIDTNKMRDRLERDFQRGQEKQAALSAAVAQTQPTEPVKNEISGVSKEEWNNILASAKIAQDGSIDFSASKNQKAKAEKAEAGNEIARSTESTRKGEAKVNVTNETATRTDANGTEVTTTRDGQAFKSKQTNGVGIESNRGTGEKKITDDGRTVYEVDKDGNMTWATRGNRKVTLSADGKNYEVVGPNGRTEIIPADSLEAQVKQLGRNQRVRRNDTNMQEQLESLRQGAVPAASRQTLPDGRDLDIYKDGLQITETDGSWVMLAFNGKEMYFGLDPKTIVRGVNGKYFIKRDGKEEELKDTEISEILGQRAKEATELFEKLRTKGQARTSTGVQIGMKDEQITVNLLPEGEGTPAPQVIANKEGSTVKDEQGNLSTWNIKERLLTIIDKDKDKPIATINLTKKEVKTDYVTSDDKKTVVNKTGDELYHNGVVKMADGTVFDEKGDTTFADGTRFNHDGSIVLGEKTRLEMRTRDTELQMAAAEVSRVGSLVSGVKARANGATVTLGDISEIDSVIGSLTALKAKYGNNPSILQRLNLLLNEAHCALDDAHESFAANTTLRASRTAFLNNHHNKSEEMFRSQIGNQVALSSQSMRYSFDAKSVRAA